MDSVDRHDGRIRKNVSKFAFRGKEKFMRSIRAVEETKDELIDNYVQLVSKQQAQFSKFQRDVKQYLQAINAMKIAADNFYLSLNDIYDNAWLGKDILSGLSKTTNVLYDNLYARINSEVVNAVQGHLHQCSDVRAKAQKRGRKLVDYDGAKRQYQTLQNVRKIENSKLMKAKETVDQTRQTYESFNTQLHQELPDLYDSRVLLSTSAINSIASAEKELFTELAEIRNKMLNLVSTVQDSYYKGDYRIERLHTSISQCNVSQQATLPLDKRIGARSGTSEDVDVYCEPEMPNSNQISGEVRIPLPAPTKRNDYVNVQIGVQQERQNGLNKEAEEDNYIDPDFDTSQSSGNQQPIYDSPASSIENLAAGPRTNHISSPADENVILPPHFLYKAQAMYPYKGTDDDELSFSKGDIIYVVQYPDPEEQDEGWQMGILKSSWDDNQSTSAMAVFPENFTKRL